MGDLREGQVRAVLGEYAVGGGADELVASEASPQEACVVHGEGGTGDRLLGVVLRRGDHREEADSRRMESLPLGGEAIPATMTY